LETTVKRVRVAITVPETAEGEFIVTPYDETGPKYEEQLILKPGDTYEEEKEIRW